MRPSTLAAILVLAAPGAALAHAHLKSSAPAADATAPAPREIRVTFTEAVVKAFTSLTLHGPGGKAVKLGAARLEEGGRTIVAAAPALAPGAYHVDWKAVAADTHRSSGAFAFTVR